MKLKDNAVRLGAVMALGTIAALVVVNEPRTSERCGEVQVMGMHVGKRGTPYFEVADLKSGERWSVGSYTFPKDYAVVFGLLGVVVATGYGLSSVEFGGVTLTSTEAWQRGVAQPYVISGLILVGLAFFLSRGATWARWLILLWCPATIIGGMAWALSRGVGAFNPAEFAVLGLPVLVIWLGGVYWVLFREPKPA